MNDEQAREVFHATHESVFAMIDSYRFHTQLYARLRQYLSSYSKLVYIFVCGYYLFGVRS